MQTHVFDKIAGGGGGDAATGGGGGEGNGMTRVAGASIAALCAYKLNAGLRENSPKDRRAAYTITAGHSAVGAGMFFWLSIEDGDMLSELRPKP